MTQQSGNQFEDDLTMGMDKEESFITDSVDLLGISGDENSPIARLKSIILSIDWEINDDILQQLDDELHDLEEVWANDKIKQVYVQGLSKIGKYIYKEKAGAHPNSIKLLITFYHNLEKIVTNDDSMSEDEKKQLLLADVKKFDQLKSLIAAPSESSKSTSPATVTISSEKTSKDTGFNQEPADVLELKTLKAQVLGIDWEINDREIEKLGQEVKRLETVFGQSKAKLILLQGLGALSSYINKKRSQSNSSAFSLLHSFYVSLETISGGDLSAGDEKKLLLSEVSKFNAFKTEITTEKESPASVVSDAGSTIEHAEPSPESPAALSDDSAAENEADESTDDAAVTADITSRLSSVFGEDELEEDGAYTDSDETEALAGVAVETEADDESGEEALPYQDGNIAPALSGIDEDSSFSVEKLADDLSVALPTKKIESIVGDDIEEDDDFSLDDSDEPVSDLTGENNIEAVAETEELLQGVDVETEADDDSDEDSLPMEDGELAPALAGAADESGFNADTMASECDQSDTEAIENRLGSFFDDEVVMSSEGWVSETSNSAPAPEETEIDNDRTVNKGIVAALSDVEEEIPTALEDDNLDEFDETEDQETGIAKVLSEQIFEEVEETIEDDQPVFDDDPVPALFESEQDILTEDIDDDIEGQKNEEALVEEGLSFLDDDIDEEPEDILLEEKEAESDANESLAFLDEDTENVDEQKTKNTQPLIEEEEESAGEDVFDFFDDEEEPVQDSTKQPDDEIAFEVEAEDLDDDDEIEFTVPGEDIESVSEKNADIDEKDDEIMFAIPGETIAATAAVATAVIVPTAETKLAEVTDETTTDLESEDVVFEAVEDDVELDLLPGEEFDDSVILDEAVESQNIEEEVEFTAVDEGLDTGRYESLTILITAIQGNVEADGIQDILSEVNKQRSSKNTSYSDKTFLQLLSTVAQFVDKNRDDSQGLRLMNEIVSGLEMSDSSTISDEIVQEKLFTCTSRMLLLQSKVVPPETPEPELVPEMEIIEEDVNTEDNIDTENYTLTGEDEQLASFVQKELADIRKLFVEEIGSLRKELADKK